MIQVIPFNQSTGGTTPNFCLANVCAGYGIPNKYASAWQAWLNTEQHSGEPPLGFDVPVFFSYTATIDGINQNWGHIGVRLANGQFWSDGHLYSSIAAYTANHTPKYVGWGESVNNVKIIGEDMVVDANNLKYLYLGIYAQDKSDAELASDGWIGQDYATCTQALLDYANRNNFAYWQVKPALEKQIADLQAQATTKQVNVDATVTVTPPSVEVPVPPVDPVEPPQPVEPPVEVVTPPKGFKALISALITLFLKFWNAKF